MTAKKDTEPRLKAASDFDEEVEKLIKEFVTPCLQNKEFCEVKTNYGLCDYIQKDYYYCPEDDQLEFEYHLTVDEPEVPKDQVDPVEKFINDNYPELVKLVKATHLGKKFNFDKSLWCIPF